MKILLVDDEASIERLVSRMITDAGYEFAYAENGFDALAAIEREKPDLVSHGRDDAQDGRLHHLPGNALARLRRARDLPVCERRHRGQRRGLLGGGRRLHGEAFRPRGLLMHIEAQIRRAHMASHASPAPDEVLHVGRFTLDVGRFRVTKGDARLALTPKEFKIFHALASNPGLVLSKEQLVEAAWGKEFVGETSSITVFIKKLREKVEDDPSDPRVIQTVWGIGYRLEPEAC